MKKCWNPFCRKPIKEDAEYCVYCKAWQRLPNVILRVLVPLLLILILVIIIPQNCVPEPIATSTPTTIVSIVTKTTIVTDNIEIINTPTPKIIVTPTTIPKNSGTLNGKIVFTCQVDKTIGHDQICLINADGSDKKQLTKNLNSENYYPSLYGNGSKVIFSSSLNGGYELFSVDINGKNLKQLTSNHGEFYSSDVSPDGKYIVATRHQNGKNYISLLKIDGSFIRDLNSYYDCKEPVWSPDGSEILFAANIESKGIQFYIMDKNGNNVRKISNLSHLTGRSDWGTNGQMASFSGEYKKQNRELFLFDEKGSVDYLTSGGDNLAPSFSPDGNWIAFTSYRDNFGDPDGCEIYLMRLSDGYVKRVTDNDYCDYQPRWGD